MAGDDDDPTAAEPLASRARASTRKLATDRYHLGDSIGRGGMGEIFAARDEQIGRDVAIKRMRSKDPSERAQQRFLREARIQGRLEHPAIVPVHELGRDRDGLPFFAMKKLVGTTLGKILRERGAPPQRLLRCFADVCLAVEFAHVHGVIHRDLKPDNIMLGDFGEVYVLDWGVAKIVGEHDDAFDDDVSDRTLTSAGAVIGTPAYMAPEQARGDADVDARADVYALGCVLGEIVGDDAPPELADAAARASVDDRALRIATARELGEIVQRFLDGDRDLAQRKKLAGEHLERARAALAGGDGEDHRRAAMRDAGRALALDPQLAPAAELVGKLMIEPPRETPAAVEAAIAAESQGTMRAWLKWVAWAQLGYVFALPQIVAARSYSIGATLLALVAVNLIATLWSLRTGRFPSLLVLAGMNSPALVVLSRLMSPMTVAPALGTLMAVTICLSIAVTRNRMAALVVAAIVVAQLVPWALEVAGVVSPTFEFVDHGVAIVAPGLAMSHTLVLAMFPAFIVILTGTAGLIANAVRASTTSARRRLHLQAWHLQQLVPADYLPRT